MCVNRFLVFKVFFFCVFTQLSFPASFLWEKIKKVIGAGTIGDDEEKGIFIPFAMYVFKN